MPVRRTGLERLYIIILGYWGKFTVTSKPILPMRELRKYFSKIFRELMYPLRRVIPSSLSYKEYLQSWVWKNVWGAAVKWRWQGYCWTSLSEGVKYAKCQNWPLFRVAFPLITLVTSYFACVWGRNPGAVSMRKDAPCHPALPWKPIKFPTLGWFSSICYYK